MSLEEVEELKADILMYLELAKDDSVQFWENMLVVCQDELDKLRSSKDPNARAGTIHDSVSKDIDKMLDNKSLGELDVLQKSIMEKLGSGQPVDVEYWETLLKAIVVYKCKARLRSMHEKTLVVRYGFFSPRVN